MATVMWEVKAEPDTVDRLLDWVRQVAVPETARHPSWVDAEVYRSPDHRIVVIAHFNGTTHELPNPPDDLVARPPHAWNFTRVD